MYAVEPPKATSAKPPEVICGTAEGTPKEIRDLAHITGTSGISGADNLAFSQRSVLSESSLLGWFLQASLIVIIKGRSQMEVSLIVIIKQVSA
jgi:hypothetical protein